MSRKTCKSIAIVAAVVAAIGLVSFVGGIRPVNVGVFVFPTIIAAWAFWLYKKKEWDG